MVRVGFELSVKVVERLGFELSVGICFVKNLMIRAGLRVAALRVCTYFSHAFSGDFLR